MPIGPAQSLEDFHTTTAAALIKEVSNRIVEQDGKRFRVEIEARGDDREHRSVRVLVAVSEPDLSDFFPTTADFMLSPDGSFVGEDEVIKPPKS